MSVKPEKLIKAETKPKAEPKVAKPPKAPKEPKQVVQIIKQIKPKRAPSEYNKFISEKTKGGAMDFKAAISAWNEQKQQKE